MTESKPFYDHPGYAKREVEIMNTIVKHRLNGNALSIDNICRQFDVIEFHAIVYNHNAGIELIRRQLCEIRGDPPILKITQ